MARLRIPETLPLNRWSCPIPSYICWHSLRDGHPRSQLV